MLEIVAGIEHVCPLKTEPLDVVLDAFYVFCVFLNGVGVVETKVAHTAVSFGDAEIESYCLGVPDVKISVGLRGESCLYPATILAFSQVFFHLLLYEVKTSFVFILILGTKDFFRFFYHISLLSYYYRAQSYEKRSLEQNKFICFYAECSQLHDFRRNVAKKRMQNKSERVCVYIAKTKNSCFTCMS